VAVLALGGGAAIAAQQQEEPRVDRAAAEETALGAVSDPGIRARSPAPSRRRDTIAPACRPSEEVAE
jgi:hypothetical protein